MLQGAERADEVVPREAPVEEKRPSAFWIAPPFYVIFFCLLGPQGYLVKEMDTTFGSNAGLYVTLVISARGLLTLVITPLLGALSDRYGRVPATLWGQLWIAMGILPSCMMPADHDYTLFVSLGGLVLCGLAGNPFAVAFAYSSDAASGGGPGAMQKTMSRLTAWSLTSAFITAPIICTEMFKRLPGAGRGGWMFIDLVAWLCVAYCMFVLPESRLKSEKSTEPLKLQTLNPFRYLRLLLRSGPAGPETAVLLRRLVAVIFFLYMSKSAGISVLQLFAQQNFGFSPAESGALMQTWGVFQFLGLNVASMMRIGAEGSMDERQMAWVGLAFNFAGSLVLAASFEGWMLFLGIAIAAPSIICLTSMTAYASKVTDKKMHGEAQALMSLAVATAEVVGPPTFGALSDLANKHKDELPMWLHNMPFILASLLVLCAMAVLVTVPRPLEALRQRELRERQQRLLLEDGLPAEAVKRDPIMAAVSPRASTATPATLASSSPTGGLEGDDSPVNSWPAPSLSPVSAPM
eukprot:TRINITY_DN11214_c0_g1_i1.p1 TRINITY_DN11214_c0_g1~~TRINITY_DN11214_c0_g1_i1.p1  ORF type:complete len:521 (-),score=80.94 TRINITY_DN11214_c0_g1_i1:191-1753(-)